MNTSYHVAFWQKLQVSIEQNGPTSKWGTKSNLSINYTYSKLGELERKG